jgi:hypothetical protein
VTIVDSERAEAHLRALAERELRRAPTSDRLVGTVNAVAHALVMAGALDTVVGRLVIEDLDLALDTRRPKPPAPRPGPRGIRRWPVTTAPSSRPVPVPPRLAAAGLSMPIPDGSLHVLAYARTRHGAHFIVVARTAASEPLDGFTATDAAGTSYELTFSGGGSSHVWTGELAIHPDPPPDLRWLEIAGPGAPGRRVDLTSGPAPDCLTTPVPPSPGEHLLHIVAADLLGHLPEFPPEERRAMAAKRQQPSFYASLGQIAAALRAAGALSPDSPVPGQLAAVCEAVGIDDHGLTPSGQDLPEPWASVLAGYQRAGPAEQPPDGCAGIALTLPEADGIVLSILGLHNADGASMLHVHASGVLPWQVRGSAEPMPLIWLRDSAGHWHVTRSGGGGSELDGELTMRLKVVPPLSRPDWIEVVVCGRSGEMRVTVPLRWG